MSAVFLGIDVSKAFLDIASLTAEGALTWLPRAANDESGIAQIQKQIAALATQPALIVLEATGGYQALLVTTLALSGLPVVVLNPRQARDFARASGQLAKTDKIDAATLARFAQAMRPPLRPLPDEESEMLRALMERRRQVVAMITQETNRLKQPHLPWAVTQKVAEHIQFLKKSLSDMDKELKAQIEKSPLYLEKAELLQSVPGVGPATVVTLLAALPELGTLAWDFVSQEDGRSCGCGSFRSR